MRYWDASAVVPLLVTEAGTDLCREWLTEDTAMVTWALTRIEVASAIERRARQRMLAVDARRQAMQRALSLSAAWDEVADLLAVRSRALVLLARYNLRAADALQLAAAYLASEGEPTSLGFACLDRNLADAASREGFVVNTWP